MNIKILEEKDNELLNRKEILAEVDSMDKTPSNKELQTELAKKFNTKENLVVVKQINQIYGKRTSKVIANIYKDEASLKKLEIIKEEKKEEKPAEQVPAEQKPAEAPKVEEKPKEEPKPEEKKEEPKEEAK